MRGYFVCDVLRVLISGEYADEREMKIIIEVVATQAAAACL